MLASCCTRKPGMAQKRSMRRVEVGDDEADVALQAILLADSFAQQFRPITEERPKVLLPLVNVPMIEYSLEWLASAGVAEVFVFCCAHAKQVTTYLEHSSWSSQPNITLTCIESRDCVSAGDALRVIEQRNVIRGDFVLISGDTVSNMPLKEVLKEHQERRKKDKLSLMTMVVRKSKPQPCLHQTRLGNEELLVVIDSKSKQLLHYDTLKESSANSKQKPSSRQVVLERSLLEDRASVTVRSDIQDCHVDICSPEVLYLFTDNFDYQHLRRDLVKGVLSDEVMGNKIYTYELFGHYAARIDNLRAYEVVSKDIIERWTYPMVPDIRFASPENGIRIGRNNVYTEDGVTIAETAIIGPSSVVGSGTSIGEKSFVRNSVIGKGCKIGKNVKIQGSHVWNNVTIGDNCQINSAVICDGAILKSGVFLEPGVVLSFKVVIGEKFRVTGYSKISLIQHRLEEESSDEELEYAAGDRGADAEESSIEHGDKGAVNGSTDAMGGQHFKDAHWEPSEVGVAGMGYRWSTDQEDDWRRSVAPIPAEKLQEIIAREEEAEVEDAAQELAAITSTDDAVEEEAGEEDGDEADDDVLFQKEVEDTFRRAVDGEAGVGENEVVIEVNALKLGWDRTFSDCAGAMFRAFLNLALESPHSTPELLLQSTKQVVKAWGPLLSRFLLQQDEEMEVLLEFEEVCLSENREFSPIFSQVVQDLYDKEIISEDAILAWATEKEGGDDTDKIFVRQCESFIQWLQQAEEEGSE